MIVPEGVIIIVLRETTLDQLTMFKDLLDEQGQMHNDLINEARDRGNVKDIEELEEWGDMLQNMCADFEVPGWEV